MKKETVSNDSLKEKIEEILTPYPDPMSRNDFRIACHIGTRTSLYLLQSGLVPCKNNGKKTRCYKIAKKDVAEYLYRRESDPMRYTPPSGWYYNYPKHKKPAASLERKLNYTGEERLLAKEWYEQQLANYPDVLTVAQVCEVTGYQRHTILKWCSKGLLKTILQTPKYMIPIFSTRSAENVENTMPPSRKSVVHAKPDKMTIRPHVNANTLRLLPSV
jgi:hypothetical protein